MLIFLAQTDTTVGFMSKDMEAINSVKKSPRNKRLLMEFDSFRNLRFRVPCKFRNRVRRAKKTTFIVNGNSFRVPNDSTLHMRFLRLFGSMYSSSANISGGEFDENFAYKNADVIVRDIRGFTQKEPSKIYKINNVSIRRIR